MVFNVNQQHWRIDSQVLLHDPGVGAHDGVCLRVQVRNGSGHLRGSMCAPGTQEPGQPASGLAATTNAEGHNEATVSCGTGMAQHRTVRSVNTSTCFCDRRT